MPDTLVIPRYEELLARVAALTELLADHAEQLSAINEILAAIVRVEK